ERLFVGPGPGPRLAFDCQRVIGVADGVAGGVGQLDAPPPAVVGVGDAADEVLVLPLGLTGRLALFAKTMRARWSGGSLARIVSAAGGGHCPGSVRETWPSQSPAVGIQSPFG